MSTSRIPGAVQLLGLCAIVSVQVLINFHDGRISDLHTLYFTHRLYRHPWPYVETPIQYPVLTGLFMGAAAALTAGLHSYLVVSSLGLWACAIGCLGVLWSISRRGAYCFALCPLLLVFSLLNWDLFAILLLALGWQAWTRERYGLAALWLTLGTFAKLYPVFLLLFCAVELSRRVSAGEASRRRLVRFLTVACVVTLAVNLPFVLLAYHNWLYFWSFNASRNQHADLLAWLGLLDGVSLGTTNLLLSTVVLGAIVAGVIAVRHGTPMAHVSALVFFVFMAMQKVYSPQYTLWLVMFALVAGWEPWAAAVLSLVGLMDYTSAVIHIALVQHHRAMVGWYDRYVGAIDHGERLIATLGVAAAAARRARMKTASQPLVTVTGSSP